MLKQSKVKKKKKTVDSIERFICHTQKIKTDAIINIIILHFLLVLEVAR